jgi:hypothetical protein
MLGNWWHEAALGESISTIPCIGHRYNPVDPIGDPLKALSGARFSLNPVLQSDFRLMRYAAIENLHQRPVLAS